MDGHLYQQYTIPHVQPKNFGKKAMAQLPQFLCHLVVKHHNKMYLFAANARGEVVYWRWGLERPGCYSDYVLLGRHEGSVLSITYNPTQRLLFTGSVDHSIKVWDPFGTHLQKNSCLQTMYGHDKPITTLTYHYSLLISGGADKTIRIWKPEEGREKANLHPWFMLMKVINDFDGWVTCAWSSPHALSGDQGELVVGDMKGYITVFKSVGELSSRKKIVDFKRISKVKIRKLGVTHIVMLYGHNLMITSGYDNTVKFTDISGATTFSYHKRPHRITGISWNQQHEEIITVDVHGMIDVFQYRQSKIVASFSTGPGSSGLGFYSFLSRPVFRHPDSYSNTNQNDSLTDEYILCCGRSYLHVWKIERYIPHVEYKGHTGSVIGLFVNENEPADSRILSVGQDDQICVWSVDKFDMICRDTRREELSEISSSCYVVTPTANSAHPVHESTLCITGHDNGEVTFWNVGNPSNVVTNNTFLYRLKLHENTTSCMSQGIDSQKRYYVITGGFDGRLGIVNITYLVKVSRRPTFETISKAHDAEVLAVCFNPLNDTIISSDNHGKIRVWTRSHKKFEDTNIAVGDANSVAGSTEHTSNLFKTEDENRSDDLDIPSTSRPTSSKYTSSYSASGEWVMVGEMLGGHSQGVTCLALDGYFLFSAGEDARIVMWNSLSRIKLKTFSHLHEADVCCMRVIPSSGNIISCSRDGTILMWDYTTLDVKYRYRKVGTDYGSVSFDSERMEIYAGTVAGSILRIALAKRHANLNDPMSIEEKLAMDETNISLNNAENDPHEEYSPTTLDIELLELNDLNQTHKHVTIGDSKTQQTAFSIKSNELKQALVTKGQSMRLTYNIFDDPKKLSSMISADDNKRTSLLDNEEDNVMLKEILGHDPSLRSESQQSTARSHYRKF
jgi:WD40 repeat protein